MILILIIILLVILGVAAGIMVIAAGATAGRGYRAGHHISDSPMRLPAGRFPLRLRPALATILFFKRGLRSQSEARHTAQYRWCGAIII